MQAKRIALSFAIATAVCASAAQAQQAKADFSTGRSALGLQSRGTDYFYARSMLSEHWGTEVGVLDTRTLASGIPGRTQGLNISMVGRAPLGQSLGVFGKIGAVQAMGPGGGLGMRPAGPGLSLGAGLSYDFTPRLSATLAWDSVDLRFAGVGREPVRSTSVGLQYRY
jgi:OOP family OmpA-OmpF porin